MTHTCEDASLLNSHHCARLFVIRRWSGEVTVELVEIVVLLLAKEKHTKAVSAGLKQNTAAEELGVSPYAVAHRRMWRVELPRHRRRFGRTFLLVPGSLELQLARHDGQPRAGRDTL